MLAFQVVTKPTNLTLRTFPGIRPSSRELFVQRLSDMTTKPPRFTLNGRDGVLPVRRANVHPFRPM